VSNPFAIFFLFFYTLLANTAWFFAGHNYPLDCPASMKANFRWTTTPAQLLAVFSGHSRLHEWQFVSHSRRNMVRFIHYFGNLLTGTTPAISPLRLN